MGSTLKKEDLQKLSMKQLEKFAEGVEGEDFDLVTEVLNEKRANLQNASNKDNAIDEADARVAERVEKQKAAAEAKQKLAEEKAIAAEKAKAEREKAAAEREEAKAKLKAEREAEKERVLQAKNDAIKQRMAEREAAAIKREQDRIEMLKKKAEEKEARMRERDEKMAAKLAMMREKGGKSTLLSEEEIAELRERLKVLPEPVSKTEQVKNCMLLGFNNKQISSVYGLPTKFVCDTTWRLERSVSFYIAKKEFAEKQSATEKAE